MALADYGRRSVDRVSLRDDPGGAVLLLASRGPADTALGDAVHQHVPARRLDAPYQQYAVSVDFREQYRGSARQVPLSAALSGERRDGGADPGTVGQVLANPDGRRERRGSRRARRLSAHL